MKYTNYHISQRAFRMLDGSDCLIHCCFGICKETLKLSFMTRISNTTHRAHYIFTFYSGVRSDLLDFIYNCLILVVMYVQSLDFIVSFVLLLFHSEMDACAKPRVMCMLTKHPAFVLYLQPSVYFHLGTGSSLGFGTSHCPSLVLNL